jgi:hypothetical protein
VARADVDAVSDDEESGLKDEERDEEGRGSTRLMTRRLSLRTQFRASYGIYTKGDVAKDNTRTNRYPTGSGAAVGNRSSRRNGDSGAYDNKL